MIARMWEARANPETCDALLEWVWDSAVPRAEAAPGHVRSDVYRSADHRVVVITTWNRTPVDLPEPPGTLMARPAHAWDFTPVARPQPA